MDRTTATGFGLETQPQVSWRKNVKPPPFLRKAAWVLFWVALGCAALKAAWELLWRMCRGVYQLFWMNGAPFYEWQDGEFREALSAYQVLAWGWTTVVAGAILGAIVLGGLIVEVRRMKRLAREDEATRREKKLEEVRNTAFAQGVASAQSHVRKALIHAYRPMMTMPEIRHGMKRIFWIELTMLDQTAHPTDNRSIMWCDVRLGAEPSCAIGAPAYNVVRAEGNDKLAIMGVVYTLYSAPSPW